MSRDGHIKRIGSPPQSEMMPRVQVGKGRSIVWFVAVGDSIESVPGYRNDFHAAAAIQNDEWLHRIAADTAPIVPVGALLLAAIVLLQIFPFQNLYSPRNRVVV